MQIGLSLKRLRGLFHLFNGLLVVVTKLGGDLLYVVFWPLGKSFHTDQSGSSRAASGSHGECIY